MSVAEITERILRWKYEHPKATKVIVTQEEYDLLHEQLEREAHFYNLIPIRELEVPRIVMVYGLELVVKP